MWGWGGNFICKLFDLEDPWLWSRTETNIYNSSNHVWEMKCGHCFFHAFLKKKSGWGFCLEFNSWLVSIWNGVQSSCDRWPSASRKSQVRHWIHVFKCIRDEKHCMRLVVGCRRLNFVQTYCLLPGREPNWPRHTRVIINVFLHCPKYEVSYGQRMGEKHETSFLA